MSELVVTNYYFYAFFDTYRLFKWSEDSAENDRGVSIVAPGRKFFSLLGVITSIVFFLLLVVPGSPGFLGTPSWIALFVLIGFGAIFFLIRFDKYRVIPNDEIYDYV